MARLSVPSLRAGACAIAIGATSLAAALPAQSSPAIPAQDQAAAAQAEAAELKAQIEKLKAALAEANARIAELETKLAAAPSVAAPATPAPAPTFALLEPGQPITSVDQFFATMQANYAKDFPPPVEGARVESPIVQQKNFERWVTLANRDWKQSIRWTMTISRVERSGDDLAVTIQVIDPDDGSHRGSPIALRLDAKHVKRFEQAAGRSGAGGPMAGRWTMTGVFQPRLTANMERLNEGVFNSPPLVGPGVEFRYDINVEGLAPLKPGITGAGNGAKDEKPKPAPATTPSNTATPSR